MSGGYATAPRRARPCGTSSALNEWVPPRPLQGDARVALLGALLTLVSVVPYAAVAAAPLGAGALAGLVLAGLVGAVVGGGTAALLGPAAPIVYAPRASVCGVVATAVLGIGAGLGPGAPVPQVLGWTVACLLLAALLQWLVGVFRLGGVVRMIPHAVSTGFMTGIALSLALSQLPLLLGPGGLGAPRWPALAVGLVTLAAMGVLRLRGAGAMAGPGGLLAGMAAHALAEPLLRTDPLATLPAVSLHTLPLLGTGLLQAALGGPLPAPGLLLSLALAIALANSMETLAATVALEATGGPRVDADRALRAGAIGSVAAVLCGGLPVAPGTATSLAVQQAGGNGRRAGVGSALLLLPLALVFGPLLGAVPAAAVGGVMLGVAAQLAAPHVRELLAERRRTRRPGCNACGELTVAALVALLMLFTSVGVALLAGVVASAVLAVGQMRERLIQRHYGPGDWHPGTDGRGSPGTVPPHSCVIEVWQPVFFGTVECLVQALEAASRRHAHVVLDLAHGQLVDATAWRALKRCAGAFAQRGRGLLIVSLDEPAAGGLPRCVSIEQALHLVRTLADPPPEPSHPLAPALPVVPAPAAMRAPARGGLRPADLDPLRQALTRIVGPVAAVMVRRAAAHAADVEALCRLIAAELDSESDRQAFLREAGAMARPSRWQP